MDLFPVREYYGKYFWIIPVKAKCEGDCFRIGNIQIFFRHKVTNGLYEESISKTSIASPLYQERLFSNLITKRDSSSSLAQDDEISDGEGSSSSKIVIEGHNSFQYEGIRFTPKVIEFIDAFEGKQFLQVIRLQNIGKNPALVKIGGPSSFIFHMNKYDRNVKLLPSGKSITRKLTYVYHDDDLVQRSQIRVQINGRVVDYPIIVKRAAPFIEVQPPELDFKVINMGASAKTLKLTLYNIGGRGTKFAFDLGRNELDLVVNPPRGTIRAKSQLNVYVEMVGITEGEYYKEMWITTNERPIRVPVIAEVIRPRLEVYHPNATGDFTLIDFPATFFGTQNLNTFILKNFSSDMTPFVMFAEIAGELKSYREAKKIQPVFNMFIMSAEEGRLEPFESRIITAVFKPFRRRITDGWYHKKAEEHKNNPSHEYLVFLRINRVHCIERKELEEAEQEEKAIERESSRKVLDKTQSVTISVTSSGVIPIYDVNVLQSHEKSIHQNLPQSSMPISVEDKDIIRLCIHGEAIEPELLIQPSSLYFQQVMVKKTEAKVLCLTNMSQISMKFVFHKIVNIEIKPQEGWLTSKASKEVSVIFRPSHIGIVKRKIKVEVFGKSAVLFDNDKSLQSLKIFTIPFTCAVFMRPAYPQLEKCLGISPRSIQAVGKLSKLVIYENSCQNPRAAMFGALKRKTKLKRMTVDNMPLKNIQKAVHKFPNNYAVGSQNCSSKKMVRNTFTGYHCYSTSIGDDYTTAENEFKSKKNHKPWKNYLKQMSNLRETKESNEVLKKKLSNFDTSCMEIFTTCKPNSIKFHHETQCTFRKERLSPIRILIPLSPLFLCNVKVEPKLIDFSMVAANSPAFKTLKLHNMNSFPVSINFIPGKSGVTLPDGDTRVILPQEKKFIAIVFKTKDFGRYNGFLDYVINGSHQFKITVSANVVPKTLILKEEDRNLDIMSYNTNAAFQPVSKCITLINNLHSSITFHWEMQTDSAFEIEPMNGEVPAMSSMLNQVYFNIHPEKSFFSEANLICESGVVQEIKMSFRRSKTNVFFLVNRIEILDMPLNLQQKIRPIMKNPNYYDVCFEVLDWSPMPGIKIQPRHGIIKARSTFELLITLQIPVIIRFQFDVRVKIQQSTTIVLKVIGSVSYPHVKIYPSEVTMRRISAQSYDVSPLCVENLGNTIAHILIDFKDFPEYKISKKKEKYFDELEEQLIILPPKKSLKLYIHFEPSDVARYQFYLPVVINGILGPPMIQDSDTEYFFYYIAEYEKIFKDYGQITRSADMKIKLPCVCINCTVAGCILNFSSLKVRFQRLPENSIEEEEVEISNLHASPVALCFRTDDVNNKNSPFIMSVEGKKNVEEHTKSLKINLAVGEVVTLKLNFRPVKAGFYEVRIPVYVKGYNEGYAYNTLRLNGELKNPSLFADTKEIHFPPIPLGIGSEVIIQVYAEGYRSPDSLVCTVWEVEEYGKLISESIKTIWLEEPKIIGNGKTQIFGIQVLFQSFYPVSLRTFLLFSDSKNGYFPILLTGVADNCSVTTHIFLSTRCNKYKFVRDNAPIIKELEEDPYFSPSNPKDLSKKISKTNNVYKKDVENVKKLRIKNNNNNKYDGFFQGSAKVKIDMGPKLVIQLTKSMTRMTQLNFVSAKKPYDFKQKESSSGAFFSSSALSHSDMLSTSTNTSSLKAVKGLSEALYNEVSYPNFPNGTEISYYEKYLMETLKYVELWIYEVGLHCEEYMIIPTSFQMLENPEEQITSGKRDHKSENKKTIIDLIVEFAGPQARHYFPDKPFLPKDQATRVETLYNIFYCLLHFLHVQGSFLPHVRPEILFCYEDYINFLKLYPICEMLKCEAGFPELNRFRKASTSIVSSSSKSGDKDEVFDQDNSFAIFNGIWNKNRLNRNIRYSILNAKEHKKFVDIEDRISGTSTKKHTSADDEFLKEYVYQKEILDQKTFNLRSTQAWLDVIIQIYRTLVLPKVVVKKTIPVLTEVEKVYSTDVMASKSQSIQEFSRISHGKSFAYMEHYENNTYTVQERILLHWLNHHYEVQRTVLWSNNSQMCSEGIPPPRQIDSFRNHLSDSLPFIAVTASHCPYLIPHYFIDIFQNPRNAEQMYHNAIKITSAWREVNIGLTVEPKDIISGNKVFMIMITSHLYEILPLLYPRSVIRFAAPLTSEVTKLLELTNSSKEKVVFEGKFIGDEREHFTLSKNESIIIRANKKATVKISFRAKRIQKVSVTLLLFGLTVSPHFGNSLVFQLEGEPSELTESSKIKISFPLYDVTCMNILITPPYKEPANYEISYSTESPTDSDPNLFLMKPWKDIWNKKTARRLFLEQNYLNYNGLSPANLNVTVSCLTTEYRAFWLLFRSHEVGDFIFKIEVNSKPKIPICGPILANFPESWNVEAECTCIDVDKNLRSASSGSSMCPFLWFLKVPSRNSFLWNSAFIMFQKSLVTKEKTFWKTHFETNIGMRLIKWLLGQDESPEIMAEFFPCLQTQVTYMVKIDHQAEKYVRTVPTLEISDVRSKNPVFLPIHISNKTPSDLTLLLTMTSKCKREMRVLKYNLRMEEGSSKLEQIQETQAYYSVPQS